MQRMQSLTLVVLSLGLITPAAAETASQVFQQVSPSIVVVATYDASGKPTEQGSGVMLPNRDVATNCHVLKDGTQYRVRYRDKDYPAQLDKSDWDHDVCSLTVPGLPAPPVVLGNTQTLQVGAQVYAIGAPEGLQLTLSEGIVSSLRPVGGGSYIQTTAAISPGSSGGGLFDDQGHLLGLTSFYMAQGQQLNFALPVEWIEALPQRSAQRVAQRTGEMDWFGRAVALETTKDWPGLVRWSQAWIKAWPRSALPWAHLGMAYDGAGQYAKAINAYRQALQISPQDAGTWDSLGRAYDDAGQHAEAIDAYRQALQVHPQLANTGSFAAGIWNDLGGAYNYAGQHAEAVDAYRQALQISPQFVYAWTNLGDSYDAAGQYDKAIDAYRQALQISPQFAHAWAKLGDSYDDAGRHAEAIDAYRQALQISPRDAVTWYNLGIDYDDAGQYAQAIGAYRQALQISPRDAETWNNLGVAYNDAGQYAEAVNAYRQALQINPKNAKTWFGLGLVYNETGQNAQALVAYQQLKSLSPELAQELFDTIAPK